MKGELSDYKKRLNEIKAADLMSKFAITMREEDTVDSLAHLMMRFKISGVPVLSRNEDIVGIITVTDLFNLMKAITNDIDNGVELTKYQNIKINEVMTRDVVSITEETNLGEIIRIMCEKNIHTLPVVDTKEGKIIGVIGRRDVLNAFYVKRGGIIL